MMEESGENITIIGTIMIYDKIFKNIIKALPASRFRAS
jgi:hypothetical protein